MEDEYAPQVVELLENTDSGGIDHPMEQNVPAENAQPIAATTSVSIVIHVHVLCKWVMHVCTHVQ